MKGVAKRKGYESDVKFATYIFNISLSLMGYEPKKP